MVSGNCCLGDSLAGQTLESSHRYCGAGARVVGKFFHNFKGFARFRSLGTVAEGDSGQQLTTDLCLLIGVREALEMRQRTCCNIGGGELVDALEKVDEFLGKVKAGGGGHLCVCLLRLRLVSSLNVR